MDAAVAAAHEAFLTWREQSWVKRGEVIDELAQLIKRDVESLSRMVTIECGKPINEGRADVVEALHMAQYVAGLSRLPYGHVISSEIAPTSCERRASSASPRTVRRRTTCRLRQRSAHEASGVCCRPSRRRLQAERRRGQHGCQALQCPRHGFDARLSDEHSPTLRGQDKETPPGRRSIRRLRH
ncbi:MAG: aldehyde dehydrogenase family protein [Fimbriimonadaceae bacterium]|nr:MAG: aldehyde dehydrogenase family protein [Fimbriimonadaceae bacterium]